MDKFKFVKKQNIDKLSKTAGVYVFFKKTTVLYIGKAKNLRERVKNHFFAHRSFSEGGFATKDNFLTDESTMVGYVKTDSEIEALILEANLIKKHKPKYNVIWKDDKNYFFVSITKEIFPRIFITHQIKLKVINHKLKASFIGPFVDGNALKQTLKFLRKAFPYRSCNTLPKKPCLWYQLGRCPAPCILKYHLAKQIPISELKMKKEYRKNIKHLTEILQGKEKITVKNLRKEMKQASKYQDFEQAGKIRDRIRVLERVFAHAKVLETDPSFAQACLPAGRASEGEKISRRAWQNTQATLQRIIEYQRNISKIEAYDISNIQGKNATGSQVAFVNGKPDKKYYRKFKILSPNEPNDVGMIKEVLQRRLNHPEWPYPEIILIDGGIAQLNAALIVRNKHGSAKSASIRVLALAKKNNELFIEGRKEPILLKNLPRPVSDLILCLRDEAHRFARKYHIKLRKRALLT